MKRFLILITIILIGVGAWFLYNQKKQSVLPESTQTALPTENFIIKHLLHEDGTIRTNFEGKPNEDIALSESIGLWMEYLVEKEDPRLFDQAYNTVKDTFLTKENLVVWQVEDGQAANTNALIDDIRIIEALFREGERVGNKDYLQTAKDMSKAVLTYNRQGEDFVDFYDVSHAYANNELTLSYLIPGAFQYMVKYDLFSQESMDSLQNFMGEMPLDNGFYPKYYETTNQIYHYDQTINLIDQIYTAIHIERVDKQTNEFSSWLKETFYEEGILYGRYDRKTKEPAVDYEAAAVYALAILYALEQNDSIFAKDIYEQMTTMHTQDAESKYKGGYVHIPEESTHSFDNLLPLLAERKLRNEQVIK